MGKSGKRKGYRPRSQRQQMRDAAAAAAHEAAAARRTLGHRYLLAACAVLAALALVLGVAALVRGCNGSTVFSTPHCRVDGDMLTYYFYDHYTTALSQQREEYVAAGLDPAKPLDGQMYDADTTWEAYFLSEVKASLRRMLVFAETAYRESSVDASAARAAAEARLAAMQSEADGAGKSLADYLASRYGVSEAVVRRAEELSAIAEARYRSFAENTYTEADRRAKYEQDPAAYRVSDVIAYSVCVDLTGISGEDAMRAEYLRAEARAKQIAAAASEGAFLAAVEADMRAENASLSQREVSSALNKAYVYHVPATAQSMVGSWVNEAGRQAGDTAVLGETGYYTVVYCVAAPRLVESHRADAQYVLVPYAAYLTEAQAEEKAGAILNEFLTGTQSSAAFAALADLHSQTAYGLFSSVTHGDADKPLSEWLLADARRAGDTAVIAASEGYYVLHYTGCAPLPLWEEMVADALREADYRTLLAASGITVNERACVLPALVPAV